MAELLIQKGADVKVGGRDGKSALFWAAEKGEEKPFVTLAFK